MKLKVWTTTTIGWSRRAHQPSAGETLEVCRCERHESIMDGFTVELPLFINIVYTAIRCSIACILLWFYEFHQLVLSSCTSMYFPFEDCDAVPFARPQTLPAVFPQARCHVTWCLVLVRPPKWGVISVRMQKLRPTKIDQLTCISHQSSDAFSNYTVITLIYLRRSNQESMDTVYISESFMQVGMFRPAWITGNCWRQQLLGTSFLDGWPDQPQKTKL